VGSYLGIYFYLRVIQMMFMSPEADTGTRAAHGRVALAASVLCLVPTILIAVFPGWIFGWF